MATRGSDPDLVHRRVGTTVRKKWRIDSLIGIGGMAAVYAATHRNGNRVALKVLHSALSADSDVATRFTREGYVANSVDHPGVVRVLDDDYTEDGAAFLVMELLKGETTDRRADRMGGRLPLQDVIAIVDGLLDVLAAAHTAGVVHRDIKPENIFFTRERTVKVLDFGIARLRDAAVHAGTARALPGASKWITQAGATLGTPAFMPPEQAAGHMSQVDALSDVWAVGATMFTLLSGYLVHEAESSDLILVAAATKKARSLRAVAPDIAESFIAVADRALEFDKGKRWSSARAMQYAMRQAQQELAQPLGNVLAPPSTSDAFQPIPLSAIQELTTLDQLTAPTHLTHDAGSLEGVVVQPPPPSRRGRRFAVVLASVALLGAGAIGAGRVRANAAARGAQARAPLVQAASSATPSAAPAASPAEASAHGGDGEPMLELDTTSPNGSAMRPRPSPAASHRPAKDDGTWLDRRK